MLSLSGTYPARAGVVASGGDNLSGITRQLPGNYPALTRHEPVWSHLEEIIYPALPGNYPALTRHEPVWSHLEEIIYPALPGNYPAITRHEPVWSHLEEIIYPTLPGMPDSAG